MSIISKRYRVHGQVQGFGFRPFVAEQAGIYSVGGTVQNAGGVVLLTLNGNDEAVEAMLHRLLRLDGHDPAIPGAFVTAIEEVEEGERSSAARSTITVGAEGESADPLDFQIIPSVDEKDVLRILPPDIATCKRCETELFDRMNRRYRHPFISCTTCGPRFTIMREVPYDREHTSMGDFFLCPDCTKEYQMVGNIRRHAQTIACNVCGPQVRTISFTEFEGGYIELDKNTSEMALQKTVEVLKNGGIVAMKNVGGYHLTHLAKSSEAAKRLRAIKERNAKPFAVMFSDMEQIEKAAYVSFEEAQALESAMRPIVLLHAKEEHGIAPEVLGDSPRIGAMLPADPIQLLILRQTGPLVMTSANLSGEPMMTEDEEAFCAAKTRLCDLVLYHDRPILQGLDDSVCQVIKIGDKTIRQVLRRARGFVPMPIFTGREVKTDTFAAGGDLKAVFGLARQDAVFLSGHFGDLYDQKAIKKREETVAHMSRLLGIEPENFVCDRHPKYISASDAKKRAEAVALAENKKAEHENGRGTEGAQIISIQHHHAHILSVMAEHYLTKEVLGVAFDGTGYGDDGTVWGGEFLLCDKGNCKRPGHLYSVPLAGGDRATIDAKIALEGYLYAAQDAGFLQENEIVRFWESSRGGLAAVSSERMQDASREHKLRRAALVNGLAVQKSSSMGRLFDAVAALIGIGFENTFEGQLACRLQYAAERFEKKKEAWESKGQGTEDGMTLLLARKNLPGFSILEKKEDGQSVYIADSRRLIADLLIMKDRLVASFESQKDGQEDGKEDNLRLIEDYLAFSFHMAIADMTVEMCQKILRERKKVPVALSGGTFANGLLVRRIVSLLEAKGYQVFLNEQVPCGDGGLALGQIYGRTYVNEINC